ncbi:MAG: tRNA (adenosine(37)-N6)-dimethylallyltransferase MiaA [Bacteroidota bacterium]|nr:tRNA (adenosine(37)-N6)-dimethylallyltransferase MiaA [Bacteroidota bacterium]
MKLNKKKLIVIIGPTASGKTDLAINLASEIKSEIISADSRQFYKELNIGTAKPSKYELSTINHHFINNLSITDDYSAGKYKEEVEEFLEEYFRSNDIAILVGGSGLFIDVIVKGIDNVPKVPKEFREELNNSLKINGLTFLANKLKQVDPESHKNIDLNNPHRVIRALEVSLYTKKPYSSYHKQNNDLRKDIDLYFIGYNLSKEILYNRIDTRVDLMIENGLVDEVKRLTDYKKLNALNTVGYKELFNFLNGDLNLDEAIELIKSNTRKYSKRQMTWFKKYNDVKWYDEKINNNQIINKTKKLII